MSYRKLKKKVRKLIGYIPYRELCKKKHARYLKYLLFYINQKLPIYKQVDEYGILHEVFMAKEIIPSYNNYLKYKENADRSKSKGNKDN